MATDTAPRPVRRLQFSAQDEAETEEFIRQMYTGSRIRFVSINEEARFSATVSQAGGIAADHIRSTVDYSALADPLDYYFFLSVYHGSIQTRTGRDEITVPAGGSSFYPVGVPLDVHVADVGVRSLRMPAARLAAVAGDITGIVPQDLRFEGVSPISAAMGRHWSALVDLVSGMMLARESPMMHPLLAEELTRTAATAALHTFPNTALTVPGPPGPGWVPPVAARRAAEFIEAHADEPITLEQIAAAAGVTGRAVQYAFRRHFDMTPIGYLRHIRLERADRELRTADRASGVTVAAIAHRWGWAGPGQFAAAYRQRFGVPPSHTLRT